MIGSVKGTTCSHLCPPVHKNNNECFIFVEGNLNFGINRLLLNVSAVINLEAKMIICISNKHIAH